MSIYSSAQRRKLPARLAFVVLPFGLFVALVTSGGNYLQYFAFSMLEQGVPDSLHPEQAKDVVQLPALDVWLLQTFSWQFIVLGVAVSVSAFWSLRIRHAAIRFAVAVMFGLCLLDLYSLTMADALNGPEVAKSFLSNLVAGVMVAWLACIGMWAYEAVGAGIGTGWSFRAVAALTVIAIGTLVSASLYYALFFFVQRTEVHFSADASPPTSGVHAPEPLNATGDSGKTKDGKFSLLPADAFKGSLGGTAPRGNLKIVWNTGPNDDFDVKLTLFADCFSLKDALAVRPTRGYAEFKNPRFLNISFDSGLVQTETTNVDGKFAFHLANPTFFWLDEEGRKSLKVTEFIDPKDVLSVRPNASMSIFISAALQIVRNHDVIPAPREARIDAPNSALRVRYVPATRLDPGRRLTCRGLSASNVINGTVSPNESGGVLGVLVDFQELPTLRAVEEPYSSQMQLQNQGGWAHVILEKEDDISDHSTGETGMLGITKGLKRLDLDGERTSVRPGDSIVAIGSIEGRFTGAKSITFSGDGRDIWQNGSLKNPSRWGRLSTTWEIAVLGWFGTIVLTIIKLTQPVVQRLRRGRLLRLA